ncbi:hypothetical protein OSTOST_12878 [Ostertagia ostertagi]
MQQATVNLFADMGVQPGSIMSGLSLATASTDFTAPVVSITSPANNASLTVNTPVTISGTASDVGGTLVGVYISTDGGTTWKSVTGTTSWTYSWTPTLAGPASIMVKGFDDSGNMGTPGAAGSASNRTITITGSSPTCPCNIFPATVTPQLPLDSDNQPIEVGVKFRSTQAGYITGVRFWKGGASNNGVHVGHLWSSTGTNPSGYYSSTNPYFTSSVTNGYLTALASGVDGPNGLYIYTTTGNVSGTVNVTATATDNVGVAGVQFLLNGTNLGAEDTASPFTVAWNTLTSANGSYTLTARARDAAGNITTSTGVVVTVNNDTQAPTVAISAPTGGTILGTIDVSATASDNVGVTGVQFLLDGNNLGAEDLVAPYTISWNTTTIVDGIHTLTAKARDAAGNITTSVAVVVTVQNNPPDTQFPTITINAPVAGEVAGTINVSANASDNVGVIGVQFLLDGVNLGTEDLSSPYSTTWNTKTVTNGTYTLTARARDAAGNVTTSASVIVTVNNIPDTQAPTVTITSPAAGPVTGTINISANSSDNTGVAGVQFLLNGVNLGSEDTIAPYTLSWNSASTVNGNYTIAARARDSSGMEHSVEPDS